LVITRTSQQFWLCPTPVRQSGFTSASASRVEIRLARAETFNYDALDVVGMAALAGSPDTTLTSGFTPALDDTFNVVRARGGTFGQFVDVELI
jgi:hypothetical protein